jgi:hypothetical protein
VADTLHRLKTRQAVALRLPNPRVPKRFIVKIRAFFVDLEKLIGWKGGNITVSGLNRDGSSFST